MLQFILGSAGTGKREALIAQMRSRAGAGRRSVLLVPEQFSWEAERTLLRALGERAGALVEVYSFTSLARAVEKKAGGGALRTLDDAGRAVLVRRAVRQALPRLRRYGGAASGAGFTGLAAEAIRELKTAGVSPEQLADAGGGDGQERLSDIALLYSIYEQQVQGRYAEDADRMALAARRMPADFFANAAVFIDGFDGFTAPEMALLAHCVAAPEGCWVALLTDALYDRLSGLGLFSPVQKTAAGLIALAQRADVPVAKPIVLTEAARFAAPGLAEMDDYLRGALQPCAEGESGAQGVYFSSYSSLEEEARAALAAAAGLVRRGEAGYGEITFITRDMDLYRQPLRRLAAAYRLPLFFDETATVEHSAPVVLVRALLAFLKSGYRTPSLLRLLKTGLLPFAADQVTALENYVYIWQVEYEKGWKTPFAQNPAGFGADIGDAEAQALRLAEELRNWLVQHLEMLAAQAKNADGAGIAKALYAFMEEAGVPGRTAALAGDFSFSEGREEKEDFLRLYNETISFLDEMALLLADEPVSAAEFDELFLLLVRGSKLGARPQPQATITVTSADRMRLSPPKAAFVLGAGEGQFPAVSESQGLLTYQDREYLKQFDMELRGDFLYKTLQENLYFYKALTAPSHLLSVSWSVDGEGAPVPMTSRLLRFAESCKPAPLPLALPDYAATPAAALSLLARQLSAPEAEAGSLAAALRQQAAGQRHQNETAEESIALDALLSVAGQGLPQVGEKGAMEKALGAPLRLSPTAAERYKQCPFQYFMRDVLKVKPRRRAELSPLETGSYIHYLLQHTLQAGDPAALTEQQLQQQTADLTQKYVETALHGADTGSKRFGFLLGRMQKSAVELLRFVVEEQRQSRFHPAAFELELGKHKGAEGLVFETPTGQKVQIIGKVDRVDVMEREGKQYLRVIDYKTGAKTFSLDQVYHGLNLQMLLYLFALCKGELSGAEALPAGVLYLLADEAPSAEQPGRPTEGLVLGEAEVLDAMEPGKGGLYIPVKFKKDGQPVKSVSVASAEKLARIEQHIADTMAALGEALYGGDIAPVPVRGVGYNPCEHCDYRAVCRHREGLHERALEKPQNPFDETAEVESETEMGEEGAL